VSAEALEQVRAYVAERHTTGFLVLSRGRLVYEWYGDGFDANSRTNGMSMTKTITALAFGVLQGEKRLPPVERPIAESWFPEWSGDATRSLITWRDLLEMASGLRNDQELKLGSDLVRMHLGTHLERTVLAIPGEHTPGFAYDYNNADTQLLGLAVERASGQRLATVISDRIWRPIGAGDAALYLDRNDGTAHAYCCLLATPRDWARVGQLLLDGGMVGSTQVVPRDFIIRMTLPSRNNPDYGWQLWRADDGPGSERAKERSEPLLDKAMFWLDGKGSQRVYVLPATGMVVVRVGEAPTDWDDAFVVNTLIRGTKP
jgi:CubicO group peptidase (beta-lactamase class C family)